MNAQPPKRFGKRKTFAYGPKLGRAAKRAWICDECGQWHDVKPAGMKSGHRLCDLCGGNARHFQSRLEANRHMELLMLQRAGLIGEIQHQPRFPLDVPGNMGAMKSFGTYIADFQYEDFRTDPPTVKIEDVKGSETEMSDFRRRLAEHLHGLAIAVVKR